MEKSNLVLLGVVLLIVALGVWVVVSDKEEGDTQLRSDNYSEEQAKSDIQDQINNMKSENPEPDMAKTATLKTNKGDITMAFYPEHAPIAVENFLKLAGEGYYDGIKFHRVIKDFMIQTGDPNSKDDDWSDDGQGGPGYTIDDEFNEISFKRGIVGMAKTALPNSGGSQFFITTAEHAAWLDGSYTVFGKVIEGMDAVDAIEAVQTTTDLGQQPPDHPVEDVIIESVVIKE